MAINPDSDPFRPPAANTEVSCLHCGQVYDSYRVEWREGIDDQGKPWGFWCCPIPGCDGIGFGFDILPTDPNYRDENGGWVSFDDEDEEIDEDDEPLDESETPDPTNDHERDIPF